MKWWKTTIDPSKEPSTISIDEWDNHFQKMYDDIAQGTNLPRLIITDKMGYKHILRESKRPVLTEKGRYRKSKRKSWRRTK